MAYLVDWKSVMKEARLWVTSTTPWVKIPLSLKQARLSWYVGKDCFYACFATGKFPSTWNVFKVSLEGSVSNIETLNLRGITLSQNGNIFIEELNTSVPVPMGHSTPWREEKDEELPSWDSTPGRWSFFGPVENFFSITCPDGSICLKGRRPVGVFRDKVVEELYSEDFEEALVGPYHLTILNDKVWCRNLLVSGIASPEKTLEEQFFLLPIDSCPDRFLFSGGRLYTVEKKRNIWKLCRSGVLQ